MIKHGTTRIVILTKRYAFKLPTYVSWKLFLTGLLGNMQEKLFSDTGWKQLCPVLFALPGGWLVVMRRVDPITRAQWADLDQSWFDDWVKVYDDHQLFQAIVPVEHKLDSFGWLDGKIVAIDYGS